MSRIAVMVDSSSDITNEEAEKLGIYVIRMPIVIGDKEYIEFDEIDEEILGKMMKAGAVAKTQQPPLGKVLEMWEKLLTIYDEIIFIPLSSKLSGAYQSAYLASKEFGGRVTVVDALHACAPIKVLAKYTKEMIRKGYTSKEIKYKLENETELYAILIPADLVYLKRGGRISGAAAALAGMLKIVPLLTVENGAIDVYTKVRTAKKAYQTAIEHVIDIENREDYDWMFLSVDFKEHRQVCDQFKEALGLEVGEDTIRSVIMAHTGPGTMALGRMKRPKF